MLWHKKILRCIMKMLNRYVVLSDVKTVYTNSPKYIIKLVFVSIFSLHCSSLDLDYDIFDTSDILAMMSTVYICVLLMFLCLLNQFLVEFCNFQCFPFVFHFGFWRLFLWLFWNCFGSFWAFTTLDCRLRFVSSICAPINATELRVWRAQEHINFFHWTVLKLI